MSAEREYVLAHTDDLHRDLVDWLAIPSISADPDRVADVRRGAEWLAAAFTREGFPTVEIWETPGNPAVYAEWPAAEPDAPAAVIYGHYDVQPVDPEELWERPPFEPTIVGDELFARGAVDDKGQVLFHLLGLRAHLAATGRDTPAVTLKFLIEGDEESGSPYFADLLRERRPRLDCDVVVISDTGVFERDTPSVCMGMRGLSSGEIHLHGPDVDLHSGTFGGAVPNPLHALAGLLAALHDDQGRITLPGFYDDVREVPADERELIEKLPFDEAGWLAGPAASRAVTGEAGYSTLERTWIRPTAEINGMWGGYTGPGGKTIVPSDAYAKVSFRLVPDQDPAVVRAALDRFVAEHTPEGITAEVSDGEGVKPSRSPYEHPCVQAVFRAMGRAFGTDSQPAEVLQTREGGSGPETDLAEILGAPLAFLGVGLPDDHIHSPNERVVLPMLYRGAEAAAYLWSELAEHR